MSRPRQTKARCLAIVSLGSYDTDSTHSLKGATMFRCNIDESCAPLIFIQVEGSPDTPEVVQSELLDYLEYRQQNDLRGIELMDLRSTQLPSKEVRQYITAWVSANRDAIRRSTLGNAVVFGSRAWQIIFSAWWLIQPPPAKRHRAFASLPSAMSWLRTVAHDENIDLDPAKFKALLRKYGAPNVTTQIAI